MRAGLICALIALVVGFGVGYHVRGRAINAATAKQVVKVAKVEARNDLATEGQNHDDTQQIADLKDQLAAALAHPPATRIVRVHDSAGSCVPGTQENAGAGGQADAEHGRRVPDAADPGRDLRPDLLAYAAEKRELRLQVLSCQTQWPK